MDKLYTCLTQQRIFLLSLLFFTSFSILAFSQSPCTSPVVRDAMNAKSTNSNVYDDIAIAMTKLLGEGTEAAWVMESGATFTENTDGTAHLKGIVKQFGDYSVPRRMALDVVLSGKSYSPDASGPYNQTGVATDTWYYYYGLSGTLKGLDALTGGELSLAIHMHPFQVGVGANQLFSMEDQIANGAGGWFEWTIVTQPTDNTLQFTDYIPGLSISDFALLVSGTPATPCPPSPCANIISVRKVLNTATDCGTAIPYVMYFAGNYYTAGNDLTFTEYTDSTATLKGSVMRNGQFFNVNVTYSGRTTTPPANSPKFELCATAANTNNANGWAYYPEMAGTVETEGGICRVLRRGPAFQMGQMGNLQENKLGASGWFSCYNNTNVGDFNFNIGDILDCRIARTGSIGDQVYCDVNNNGLFDAGDSTLTGLTVALCDANGTPIKTQIVDINGQYLFTNLAPDTYLIKFPTTTTDGKSQRDTAEIRVDLSVGQNYLDADKGYIDPCAIDAESPVFLNCPQNILKNVTDLGTCWNVNWTAPTATDNCSTPLITSNYNSGACLPLGATTVTYTATDIKGNSVICSFVVTIKRTISCTVTGNTLTKSCTNNTPVINGSALANHEYVWLSSTSGCPTQASQTIVNAKSQNYILPNRPTVTTYFVRCARPIGCTTWGSINESNCITVYPTDCQPTIPPCSINFSSTKSYRIVSKKSGKAIDVSGNGKYNDCPIIQWNYNGTANQQWRFLSLGAGYFKIMARHSNKYMACHNTTNASKVYQYDYYSGGYKDWKVECVGNTGYYRLVHRASGKVLDVAGGSTANGANMQIYTWTGSDNQLFRIEEVSPAPVYALSSSALTVNVTAEFDRVQVKWLTNTGYENDFYTVEKMNTLTGNFEKMALVNNTQFDEEVQTHTALDLNPTEGDNFYRLKLTLNDGQEKLTEAQKITFKRTLGFAAFPNPASDELNVNVSEYIGKSVDIALYNAFGKAVSHQHLDNVSNSINQINVSELPTGQYLIRISSEGKRDATQSVVIQK